MQKTRSGLATAAAKLQLTDAPEGESSLQSRLNEAERRAQDAEAFAQDARAALARTLLEAAQVEAVVTARVKAQSEAELSALRSQLDAVKAAAPQRPDAADGSAGCEAAKAASQKVVKPADAPAPAAPNPAARPAIEPSAEVPTTLTAVADPAERLIPPDVPDAAAIDASQSRLPRLLPPARLAFLSVTAVVAVISYLIASSYMQGRALDLSVAMNAIPGIAGFAADDDHLVQGAATDSKAISDAAATLDAELLRLQSLSKKVAAMRAYVAEQDGKTPATREQIADRKVAADRMAPAVSSLDAGWLLYMPVERGALVHYLAGRSWPGIQLAAQAKTTAPREN